MEFFTIEDVFVVLKLSPKLYNIESVYSAAYQLIDSAYVVLDGDPDIEIIVRLSHKDDKKNTKTLLETLAKEYLNHLVNYTYYRMNSKKKELLRTLLLRKSMSSIDLDSYDSDEVSENCDETSTAPSDNEPKDDDSDKKELFSEPQKETSSISESVEEFSDEDLEFEDPEGIAIPWEEKYGKGDDEGESSER